MAGEDGVGGEVEMGTGKGDGDVVIGGTSLSNDASTATAWRWGMLLLALEVVAGRATNAWTSTGTSILLFLNPKWYQNQIGAANSVRDISYLIVPPDFTNETAKGLVDVYPLLSRRLDELASEVLSQITTL